MNENPRDPEAQDPDDAQDPGDLSGFDFDAEFAKAFGPQPPVRSVIVVPVADARRLAEVCTLASVHAHVVPVRGLGCALVTVDPATGEADVENLSTVLRTAEIVLLTVREEAIEGQTWRGGTRGDDPKPGLLLSLWPDTVQQLVLGRLDAAEASGTALGGEGSRIGSFWKLFTKRGENPGRGEDETPPGAPRP